MAKDVHFFSIFSKTVHTYRAKLFTVILHLIRALCAQLHQNRRAGIGDTYPKLVNDLRNDIARSFFKISIRLRHLYGTRSGLNSVFKQKTLVFLMKF